VALSRARLGLYILGRRAVFESCFELRQAFDIILQRPDKLKLVTGELWPSRRILAEEDGKEVPGETQMEGVEHLGQYVYEMTNAKVQQLRSERGLPEAALIMAPIEEGYDELGGVHGGDEVVVEEMNEGPEGEDDG